MGETMSKRLKLHLGGEAEMEERAFTNPFPDYEAAASMVAAGAAEETGCDRPPPSPDEFGLPFHSDGKVSRRPTRAGPRAATGGGAPAVVASAGPAPRRADVTRSRRAPRRVPGRRPRPGVPGAGVCVHPRFWFPVAVLPGRDNRERLRASAVLSPFHVLAPPRAACL